MKAIAAVGLMLALGTSGAGAADIKGKWGIGAGVFDGGGEVSLIRGKSERSAWLFDVGINQRYDEGSTEVTPPPSTPPPLRVRRAFSIVAGPGYRRFSRPAESLSPYWDVRARGRYGRQSQDSARRTDTGIDIDFSFGLEYATPWRFSVAAHSGVARVGWLRTIDTRDDFGGVEVRTTSHLETFSIGIAPVLFVRAYF